MPLYEYKCLGCEHSFESLEPLDTEFVMCPVCGIINGGRETAKRVMSPANFRIKGHSEANGYDWKGDGPTYKS